MGQRPCVCNGENENCRYCFGSGYVPSGKALPTPGSRGGLVYRVRRRKARVKARAAAIKAQRTFPTQVDTAKRAYSKCPNCGVTLREDRFERHAGRCLQRHVANTPLSMAHSENIRQADSDKTGAPLHTQTAHRSPEKHPPSNDRLRPNSNSNSLVACPHCGAKVKVKRIKHHRARCPGIRKALNSIRNRKKRLAPSKASAISSSQRGLPLTCPPFLVQS